MRTTVGIVSTCDPMEVVVPHKVRGREHATEAESVCTKLGHFYSGIICFANPKIFTLIYFLFIHLNIILRKDQLIFLMELNCCEEQCCYFHHLQEHLH